MSGNHYNFSRDRTPPTASAGANGPVGRFESTDQTVANAVKASRAARKRAPVDFDFDSAIARLKIILAEFYPDDE